MVLEEPMSAEEKQENLFRRKTGSGKKCSERATTKPARNHRAGVKGRRYGEILGAGIMRYSLWVEAADEEAARSKAAEVHHSDWEMAWSGVEVDAGYSNGDE